ncbi:MAG: Ig-like domain-containing protein [Chloroflexi bacterium]|nr:Ig-like domain-containing protein [Chloroflexota bacterium]
MNNKQLFRVLGILVIGALAFLLTKSVFFNNTPLTIAAQPTGPQVISQEPIEGQRLELSSSIEFTFDRDMDKPKTGDSFSLLSDGEVVPGQLTWTDARTLSFTPNSPLNPGTDYTATFSTQAAALDGTSPRENIEIQFKTMEALSVAQVFPAADTQDVDLASSITVIFNHPVVPVTIVEEQGKLPQPLQITPKVKGKGEWVNSSVYVFQPEEILLSGTHYQVSVDAGLKDTLNNILDESFSWLFDTRAPGISNFALKDGEQNPSEEVKDVPLDQVFIVTFQQPMDQESTQNAVKIINRETSVDFPVNYTWDETFTTLAVEPKGKFALASFYKLTILNSAQASDGGNLSDGLTIQFATVPLPSVLSVSPVADSKENIFNPQIIITFASQMNFDSLKGKVRITPALEGEPNWYYNPYDKTLNIFGLSPATDYVVRILPGMEDIYGNKIKDGISYTFKNGDYSPYARLVLPWMPLIYRAEGPQEVYFEHLNIDEATVSIYPVSFDEFGKLTDGRRDLLHFNPDGDAVREWNLGDDQRSNKLKRELLKFADENGNPLETGYYFIGVKGKPMGYDTPFYQGNLFIVATDNVTFKAAPTEGLAWVTDLESGAPQENVSVTFYNNEFTQIGKTTTDKDGIAFLKDMNSANFARVDDKDHLGFTALYWGSGVSAGDFGLYENYYGGISNLFAYLYTDRPVYRPDQEVFFKGILRENDDLHYSLPKQEQVYVVVDQFGERIFTEYVPVNEQGSFTGKIELAQDVSLGTYNISVYKTNSPDEAPFSSVSFNVAEYKKPEFEVKAVSDKTDILTGDTVNFGLDAAYYSGGSLKDAPTNWFIESSTFYFTPATKYNQYSFMDWDRDIYWSPDQSKSNDVIDEGQGVTDDEGHLDISQTFEAGKDKISQQMTFYANVTDVAGNTVSGSTSLIMHQSEFYAGIRSERYIGTKGEAQPFNVVVLDWASQPIAGQKVSVDFVERQWFSVQKKDKQGQLSWETSVKEIPVSKQSAVTGADGTVQVDFIPPKGGVYKATITVRDSKGNSHQASTYIWVASDEDISWRQTNDRAFSLIADKEMYAPGETAEILIAQPFKGKVYALITYERGHVYKQEVVLLEGSSTIYKLPITDELAPIAYVSVTVISGAKNTGAPDFKIGITQINIDTKQKEIAVSITTDKESAGPGDEVTYTIETKDINGKPVSADVSLAVVDKAVLALAPSNSAPLLASFYSKQPLGVVTALGIVSSADDFNADYRESIPDGNQGGGGGDGDLGIITVRENFKDTAVFKAEVTTDENGIAQVKVKLPENLTTWVADVRAVTADSRVGQTTNELVSTKPLFVQLQTPRFFVVGDQATVGATIFNNTEKSLKVNVSLDAQGVDLKSEAEQTIEIEGKQQAYVTWDVNVKNNIQRVDMTATVISGEFTDASKPALGTLPNQGIPVFNFTTIETVGTSGMISSADSITENIQLPTTLKFDNANLSIEVSPSLAASMGSALTYLEDYKYLCMEQTISRFLPNVISSRALKVAGIPFPEQADLDAQVNAALQRIYAKQLYDGGWNWWDGQESDPQTSTYVVYGLLEAKESGYVISETVLSNGINYLKGNLPDLRRNDASWQFNRHAFMLYVLARADALGAGQTNFIFEHRASLDLYGEAYLAQAMYLLDPEDSRISTLLSDLATATVQSAAGAHWEEATKDYWNWNSDTRTTAIVLNTFVQIDPQNPINASAVRWLMAHRDGGHWYSTQETTWSLIALTNWLVSSKEYETDYKYAIGLNGDLLQEGEANKDNLTDTIHLQVQLKDLLKEQSNSLVITRGRGTGNLYYTAYLSTSLPVESIQPLDQGISLSREYFALDDPKTPITKIARGELVKVRLTVVVPAAVHYIVIDDPLPAGMEAIDSTLAADTAVPTSYTLQDYKERGWGWWYFSHIELRDEKLVLSADYLPAGTYVYTYIARASTKGIFKVVPPTAAEFYFPDVGGRGAGSLFEVK